LVFIEEIEIFTFLNNLNDQFVHFSHTFKTIITHDAVENAESSEDSSQQHSMAPQVYQVNVHITDKGVRNQLSERPGSIDNNPTGYLQRYVVLGRERNRKILEFKINYMLMEIMSWEHNVDFHHRTTGIWRASVNWPDQVGLSIFYRGNNFCFE
jgi:hypothetical protein